MTKTNMQQQVESINNLLWEIVSDEIENPKYLTQMLKEIHYLDNKETLIQSMDSCDVFISDEFIITKVDNHGPFVVSFNMPIVLNAYKDRSPQLRITTTVVGDIKVDMNYLSKHDFSHMNKYDFLSYKPYSELIAIHFEDSECDELNA